MSGYTLIVSVDDRFVPVRLRAPVSCAGCGVVLSAGLTAWLHAVDTESTDPVSPRCTSCMLRSSDRRFFTDGRLRLLEVKAR